MRNEIFLHPRPLLLTVAHLKKAGLLNGRRQACWVNIGAHVGVQHKAHRQLIITVPKYSPELCNRLTVDDPRFWSTHVIRYEFREPKFGPRPYFVCPQTEEDCIKLVFYQGLACSLPAFNLIKGNGALSMRALKYEARRAKLLKYDGTLRSSDEEKETHLTFLRKNPRRLNADESIIAFLERQERRTERERKKFLWESRVLSTTKALDCGRGAYQHLAFDEYLSLGLVWAHEIPAVEQPSVVPPPDSIEHYPALDMRILLDRGYFKSDRVTGIRLGWPVETLDGRWIYLFFDPRPSGMPLLVARIEAGDSMVKWQSIRLRSGPRSNKPRYMMCPLSDIRSDVLYFRNGIFASREAHGLHNPSQRAAGKKASAGH